MTAKPRKPSLASKEFLKDWHNQFEAKKAKLIEKHGPAFNRPVCTFSLNMAEQAVVDEWLAELRPEILAMQKQRYKDDASVALMQDEVYYGATGGGLTYSFIPTSLGSVIVVKEAITGKELNVTQALDWFFYG